MIIVENFEMAVADRILLSNIKESDFLIPRVQSNEICNKEMIN